MKADDKSQAPVTDDAELAKVLEGMGTPGALPAPAADGLQFEESPLPAAAPAVTTADEPTGSTTSDTTSVPEPTLPELPAQPAAPQIPSDLDAIKKDALSALRPLVDKLNLPADEKFDTLLLIIRSTDDQSLIGAAHDAAKLIEDETRRAQALLDIIKEIDYFSSQTAA